MTHTILESENIKKYMMTDKIYQSLNPYQKENIILPLFHSINWNKIDKIERSFILQELENIEAKKLHRNPYQLILLKSDYKWNDFLMDFCVDHKKKKIYSRRNYVEDGICQKLVDGKVEKELIPYLNLNLLDCLFHEQWHIMTKHYLLSSKTAGREHLEFLIWQTASSTKRLYNNQEMMKNRRYIYRMFPDEYYAFLYAEEKVKNVFHKLESSYGKDPKYEHYLRNLDREKEVILINYQEIMNDNTPITYDELYQKHLNDYIESYANEMQMLPSDIKKDLSLQKTIIKRNIDR